MFCNIITETEEHEQTDSGSGRGKLDHATSRMTGVAKHTILRLLAILGNAVRELR